MPCLSPATGFISTEAGAGSHRGRSAHQCSACPASDAGAGALAAAGAEVHRGADLEDLGNLQGSAAASDGVIHLGHHISQFQEVCEADRRAIEAMGTTPLLAGSDRLFVITSSTRMGTRA